MERTINAINGNKHRARNFRNDRVDLLKTLTRTLFEKQTQEQFFPLFICRMIRGRPEMSEAIVDAPKSLSDQRGLEHHRSLPGSPESSK